jgi:fatty-acyl-CoA synthase
MRDANGKCLRCPPNEPGELLGRIKEKTSTTGSFEGYFNDSKASERKILKNVFVDGDEYFRSGDLLKMDKDGFYYFVDRIGDTFRWKGENVSTNHVANVLNQFKGIQAANVYGVSVPGKDGKCGMVSLVVQDLNFEEFYQFTKKNLTDYSNPYFLRIMNEFQNTGTFKYRKVDLVKENFDVSVVKDDVYFRDDFKKCYVKMDEEIYSKIIEKEIKF